MPDRENVITHLQIIHIWAEFARERDLQFFTPKHLANIAEWSNDAIAMPKEDCHNCKLECLLQKYDELKEKYDALLKEQEAKKVLQIRNVAYRTIGFCHSCGRGLDSYENGNSGDHITNYCYNCGQAVKWE